MSFDVSQWLPSRRLLCPLARFFRNPFHLSGVVFAMLATNMATLIWSGIVLFKRDALISANSRIAFLTQYVGENWIAGFFGFIALAQLMCLWGHWEPTRFRNIGYGILSAAWSFMFFHQVVASGNIYPVATATSATMACIAFYAWLDGHEHEADDHGVA